MKTVKIILVFTFVVLISTVVGVFKGSEAKQKWIGKFRTRYDDRRQMAQPNFAEHKGEVILDDIELASYHN